MRVWQLRKGADKRFRSGHPWVFSNELAVSPKGTPPGELIELTDEGGKFLAFGYGNPNSLISFRTLSTNPSDSIDTGFLFYKLWEASNLRRNCGLTHCSYRLCFAEGDYLPGLIIDRYFLAQDLEGTTPVGQAFVVQTSTAGMEALLPQIIEALNRIVGEEVSQKLCSLSWEQTAVVTANTSRSRELEGLKTEARKALHNPANLDLNSCLGYFQSATTPSASLKMKFSILEGQKTGFFLDQRENIRQLIEILETKKQGEVIRVLDLCCYVGQWSAQIATFAKSKGLKVECTLFDASEDALKVASQNVTIAGGMPIPIKGDVLQTLRGTMDRAFDVVICDPPAFIKKKKDIHTGQAAYLKLNKESVKKVAPGGLFVSCSCSGLFTSEDFKSMLSRVSYGANTHIQWIKSGFHSPDHPQRMEFPEGAYLKCLIGVLSSH